MKADEFAEVNGGAQYTACPSEAARLLSLRNSPAPSVTTMVWLIDNLQQYALIAITVGRRRREAFDSRTQPRLILFEVVIASGLL